MSSAMNTVTAVTQKKRGRKSLWETDYDAAVKRQWKQVMKQLPKAPMRTLKRVPVKLEVVALLTQHGEVVERYAGVIGDAPKVAQRGGRKSLWETDPEAAAARELERCLAKVPAPKALKAPKEPKEAKEPKKRGRKSLWETDPEAAAKRQHKLVLKQLRTARKQKKVVVEKSQSKLAAAKKEILALKMELDALRLPQKHSV